MQNRPVTEHPARLPSAAFCATLSGMKKTTHSKNYVNKPMPDEYIVIRRDADTKTATLVVSGNGDWRVFAGKNAATVDFSTPVAQGTGPRILVLPEEFTTWTCFALKRGGEVRYTAERHLPMAGGYNFRDLGGFAGADGKRTAWGRFFRTDDLANLTKADLAYLASIPVATVVDFRTDRERNGAPDKIPSSVTRDVHFPVAPGFLGDGAGTRYDNADQFMLALYRDLVHDPAIAETYKQFFALVQDSDRVPLLFHCAAGKDRTGLAAALILTALGVDREAIYADYEASNTYLGDKYAPLIAANPEHGGLYRVKRMFLAEAFARLEDAHGSVERYLETVLNVDIRRMRQLYLL